MEHLATQPEGVPLASIAQELEIPQSAAHRLLNQLVRCGYVRQLRDHGDYALAARVASIGLSYLSATGIVDIAQPLVDRLAQISGELVRLAIVDGEHLAWVAKAAGRPAWFALRPGHGHGRPAVLQRVRPRLDADDERRARHRAGHAAGLRLA